MGRHMGIHRNLDPLYDLPQKRLVKHLVRDMPLRVSALRSLGAYANVFAIESFMDELAGEAGCDPVSFRLRHLSDPRGRAVIEAAAARLDPSGADCPEGRGRGLGFAQYKNSAAYAAVVMEVSVSDAAEIRLERCVIAADAGRDRGPAPALAAQLEGGVIQAASWALHEAVAFDRDGIASRDWDAYPILGFDNAPAFETVLIDPGRQPFLGAGEATAGPDRSRDRQCRSCRDRAQAAANSLHARRSARRRPRIVPAAERQGARCGTPINGVRRFSPRAFLHSPLPLGGRGRERVPRRARTVAGLRPPLPLPRKRPPPVLPRKRGRGREGRREKALGRLP